MTRHLTTSVLTLALLAACGGGTASTPTPGAAATPTSGTAATPTSGTAATPTPGAATPPPAQGNATVTVLVTGGPDAGTYTGAADPHCSFGFLSPGVWGVSYGEADMTSGLTGIVLTATPASAGEWSFQANAIFNAGARTYTVTNATQDAASTISILDTGVDGGASIHVTGPAIDGSASRVEMVINCPNVTRV